MTYEPIERDPNTDYSEQSWNIAAVGVAPTQDFEEAQAILVSIEHGEDPTP